MPATRFDLPLVEETTVRVVELGYRPAIITPARRNAPQAATMIGELLGQRRFGELASVVLDWSNELGQMPSEVAKPIIYMELTRWFPEKGEGVHLTVQGRIDVDDVLGQDVLTRSLIEDLVNELGEKLSDTAKESN